MSFRDDGDFSGKEELYDLAYGPRRPRTRRPVLGEWDDPTWLQVEVDEEWMAEETARARGELVELADGHGATVRQAAHTLGMSEAAVQRALRLGTFPWPAVKVGQHWLIELPTGT